MTPLAMALILLQLASPSVFSTLTDGLISATEQSEDFHETYKVAPGTVLRVENINGDILISRWEKDYVEVHAEKRSRFGPEELDKARIDVSTGDVLRVRTVHLAKNARVSVSYSIRVPSDLGIDLVNTANGSIELKGTGGDAEVVTSNGDIDLIDARGTLRVRTSNGEIEIKGHATVREATTSNGSIRIDLRDIPKDGSEISTANGSIDIYVDVALNADLRGSTSLGKVSIKDEALRLRFTASEESRNSLEGKIGEGGRRIDVSTSNGEIRFHVLTQ